jgi:hypothetical protein
LEAVIAGGTLSMEHALASIGAHRIPASELGDPDELRLAFMNVNTADVAGVAETLLRERESGPAVSSGEKGDEE